MSRRKKTQHQIFKSSVLATFVTSTLLSSSAFASNVRSDIDYQVFRNFAENKGQFKAGNTNVPIYDTAGNYLGNALPTDVPMPDFSSTDSYRYLSALVGNQFITSVKHNSDAHFKGLEFGGATTGPMQSYYAANRNDHSSIDYNVPRLQKMVYEVEPAALPKNLTENDFLNDRFTAFARVGSGTQSIYDKENNQLTTVANAYTYATGGVPMAMSKKNGDLVQTISGTLKNTADNSTVAADGQSPLISYAAKGDSGSPLYGYDSVTKQWVLIGNAAQFGGYNRATNTFVPTLLNYIQTIINSYVGATLNVKATTPLTWSNSTTAGESTIKSELNTATLAVTKGTDISNGKDLIIKGRDTTLVLTDNINQGAGGLYFETNATVKGNSATTSWLGSGVVVDEGKTVDWQVTGVARDSMVKLGKGTLVVNATGKNTGLLNLSDGTVVLNQKADSNGNQQAFEVIQIASGRGKLVIGDSKQISNLSYIRFGAGGGTVDLNGNNFTLNSGITQSDDGARFVNENTKSAASITFTTGVNQQQTYMGDFGTVPTTFDVTAAKNISSKEGVLNINFAPTANRAQQYLLTGNTNIRGNVTLSGNGSDVLTISGAATPYASVYTKENGKQAYINELDYQDRMFVANTLNVNNATLNIGRNLTLFGSNLRANNSSVNLGITENRVANQTVYNAVPTLEHSGNIYLTNSQLNVGKANINGMISGGNVSLSKDSHWTLNASSGFNNLEMAQGAVVTLNNATTPNRYLSLTVNNLAGGGLFNFATSLADLKSDVLVVRNNVTGNFNVAIADSGKEPSNQTLTTLTNNGLKIIQTGRVEDSSKFTLENGYVDAGAYRYELVNGALKRVGTAQKTEEPYVDPDPNFTPIDFGSLDDRYNHNDIAKAAEEFYNQHPNSTSEELIAFLSQKGLIADDVTDIAFVARTYDLDNLTEAERAVLEDAAQNPDTQVAEFDNTPVPSALPETEMHDRQSAIEAGILLDSDDSSSEMTPNVVDSSVQKLMMSKYSNGALSAYHLHGEMRKHIDRTLLPHVIAGIGNDMWVTHNYGKLRSNNAYFRDYNQTQYLTQVGSKYAVSNNTVLGWAFSENRSRGDFADNITHKGKERSFDIFVQQYLNDNWFVAAQVGYGRAKSTLKVDGTEGTLRQHHWKLGGIIGADFTVGAATFTPYMGADYYSVSSSNYILNEAEVRTNRQQILEAKVGIRATVDLTPSEYVTVKPFIAAEWRTTEQTQRISINNQQMLYRFGRGVQVDGGVAMQFANVSFEMKGSIETGTQTRRNHALYAGLNIRW